jgi:hypothetical protein
MRVRSTALLIPAVLLAIPAAARGQREVTVQAATVRSLDAKLQAFAQGLAPAERAAWGDVLRQAASAPADAASGVQVEPIFYAGGTPATVLGRDPAGGIIVQGGRTSVSPHIIVQGGSPATRTNAASPHIIVQGGSPAARAAGVGGGPRSGDPVASLDAKVHAFAATLPGDEQATFDWLLQRAAPRVRSDGMPTGQRSAGGMGAATPSLGQALGVIAIGPKQDDPSPPPPESLRVMLRF